MKNNISYNQNSLAKRHLKKLNLSICEKNNIQHFYINGADVTSEIRSNEVSKNVSMISSFSFVRELMVDLQRQYAVNKSIIVEGRDIGTIVFPDADFKLFLDADIKIRAERRTQELIHLNYEVIYHDVLSDLICRDKRDKNRIEGPLKIAEDAFYIDTGNKSEECVLQKALKFIKSF